MRRPSAPCSWILALPSSSSSSTLPIDWLIDPDQSDADWPAHLNKLSNRNFGSSSIKPTPSLVITANKAGVSMGVWEMLRAAPVSVLEFSQKLSKYCINNGTRLDRIGQKPISSFCWFKALQSPAALIAWLYVPFCENTERNPSGRKQLWLSQSTTECETKVPPKQQK